MQITFTLGRRKVQSNDIATAPKLETQSGETSISDLIHNDPKRH